jgi:hypothetical protein
MTFMTQTGHVRARTIAAQIDRCSIFRWLQIPAVIV